MMDARDRNPGRRRGLPRRPVLAALLTAVAFVAVLLPDARALDESGLVNLANRLTVTDGSYRYHRPSRRYRGAVRVTSTGTEPLATPIYLVVESVTPADASVLNAHGTTTSGKPYFDISPLVAGGTLAAGASSALQALEINNPRRAPLGLRFVPMGPGGPPPNSLPRFLTQPPGEGRVGEAYRYAAGAQDDDGDPLAFSLDGAPAGMSVDPGTGEVLWTPAPGTASPQAVVLVVSDGRGGEARQAFDIVLLNTAPRFLTQPPVVAVAGQPLTYLARAEDPDGDALSFALETAPPGMTVEPATGEVVWTPPDGAVGIEDVVLAVSDGRGGVARQVFSLALEDQPPQLALGAPQSVQAAAAFAVTAEVSDDVGVSEVVFYVDGLEVLRSSAPPFRVDLTAPDQPGLAVTVRVVAVDGSGNASEASVSMPVVASPDTEAPVIAALQAPATAAPGETITLSLSVSDDRGVDEVRFFLDGVSAGVDRSSPFTVQATLSAGTPVGTVLAVRAEAQDAAGNAAEATRDLTVVAAPDTTPPSQVTLTAPPDAPPGATVRLAASAIDDSGVQRVQFRVNGSVVGEDTSAPYELDHVLAADIAVGTRLVLTVRAVDFAGNSTTSAPRNLDIVSVRRGFVLGQVYDDTTGLVLAGATVGGGGGGGGPAGGGGGGGGGGRGPPPPPPPSSPRPMRKGRFASICPRARPSCVSARRGTPVPFAAPR